MTFKVEYDSDFKTVHCLSEEGLTKHKFYTWITYLVFCENRKRILTALAAAILLGSHMMDNNTSTSLQVQYKFSVFVHHSTKIYYKALKAHGRKLFFPRQYRANMARSFIQYEI